jgi:lysyl-tRNA synthetase class 2
MTDSIKHFTGFDISGKMKPGIWSSKRNGIDVDKTMGKGKLIDEIFGAKCEKLYSTHFYHGLSKEMSPLCKHRDNPDLQNVLN